MRTEEIIQALSKLDGRGSDQEFEAVEKLSTLGLELPKRLKEKYASSKNWQVRASCVYHASKYARSSRDAYELAIDALKDKSKVVRYRACMLLALAQLDDAIEPLEVLARNQASAKDAAAAIDVIKSKTPNYFVDRDHSGMVNLNVKQRHS